MIAPSDSTDSLLRDLLQAARHGDRDALGDLLQRHSGYLKLLVSGRLDNRLQSRVNASDVVQETFLEAHRDFAQFRGGSEAQFAAWLKAILTHNLHRAIEKNVKAQKRNVHKEVYSPPAGDDTQFRGMRLDALAADPGRSPSAEVRHRESLLQLADRMAALPEDYRRVLALRHLEGLGFEEIAARMDRTNGAVRMLWLRALDSLRSLMKETGANETGDRQ